MRHFKSKISKIFWGGDSPSTDPAQVGKGTPPPHALPPRGLRPPLSRNPGSATGCNQCINGNMHCPVSGSLREDLKVYGYFTYVGNPKQLALAGRMSLRVWTGDREIDNSNLGHARPSQLSLRSLCGRIARREYIKICRGNGGCV